MITVLSEWLTMTNFNAHFPVYWKLTNIGP